MRAGDAPPSCFCLHGSSYLLLIPQGSYVVYRMSYIVLKTRAGEALNSQSLS